MKAKPEQALGQVEAREGHSLGCESYGHTHTRPVYLEKQLQTLHSPFSL